MAKKRFGFFVLSLVALVLSFVVWNARKIEAKELTNIISDVKVWKNNYHAITPDSNGIYQLSDRDDYSLQVAFDLGATSSEAADGDYFDFNVPAPLTVSNGVIELIDEDSGIAVGEGTVTSNGQGQGGNVRITLKNIATYLEKKAAQEVDDIRGTFYVAFKVSATETEVPVIINGAKNGAPLVLNIKVGEWQGWPDNADGLSGENFAKYGGVINHIPQRLWGRVVTTVIRGNYGLTLQGRPTVV